jgi:hypothetical protein
MMLGYNVAEVINIESTCGDGTHCLSAGRFFSTLNSINQCIAIDVNTLHATLNDRNVPL